MTSWPAKDPGATLDYVYRIALEPGDSVANLAAVSFISLSGTVVIQSKALAAVPNTTTAGYGQDLTVWLAGGVDQETDVFKVAWTTVKTRVNDDIITLNVASNQLPALDLVNFTAPLPGHLQTRYPAFAAVPYATIAMWLSDAQRFVKTNWRPSDYPVGIMALAAHNMSIHGIVSDGNAAQIPGGVDRFKMGPMEISLTPAAANAKLGGDLTSTRYGVEFQELRAANTGGPRVAASGVPPYNLYPLGWPNGPLGGY
jgi:Protein of unknown function (DUF4054)